MAGVERFLVSPEATIREVMGHIGSGAGFALVAGPDRTLRGTVTDGDIRRAILAGINLDQPVLALLDQPRPPEHRKPLTAPAGTGEARLRKMMLDASVRHVPLLDPAGQVQEVVAIEDLVRDYELPLSAVIMAGGIGSRLRPLTDELPKPMLPLGDRPLMEHIVGQLRNAGITRLHVTTHYKGDLIESHFGDGTEFGVDIQYLAEEEPLGTAGALSKLEVTDEPVLVMNGDIVTKLDLRAMLDFHREQQAEMTVALRQDRLTIPYGVVRVDGVKLVDIVEKPTQEYLINAGIYLLGPDVFQRIPSGRRYDMTDLIQDLVAEGRRVIGFPISEFWVDIGQLHDYEAAQAEAGGGQVSG